MFEKPETPLVQGGTAVDDAVADLVCLSELAEDDPAAAFDVTEISESISASYSNAKRRLE